MSKRLENSTKGYKQGEMTTAQIVTLVILIASFLVVCYFIFVLNLWAEGDKEICHNSVILKAKGEGFIGEVECKTSYACISGEGECEDFKSTEKVKVKGDDYQKRQMVIEAIAEKLSDCWWMFGEGKISWGSPGATSIQCAVCYVIKFDSDVQNVVSEISYAELYDYLESSPKDNVQTYLHYLYGVNSVDEIKVPEQFKVNLTQDIISTGEKYSIITGVDDNLFTHDRLLEVFLIPTSETSQRLKCSGGYITRA